MGLAKENLNKAFSLHSQGDYKNAEKFYIKVLKENPHNSEALNLLGLLKYQTNNISDAEKFITQAIKYEKNIYYYENLAGIYIKQEEWEKAIRIIKEAFLTDNGSFTLWFNLGLAYKSLLNFEEAKKAYLKALQLKPHSEKVNFNLAALYLLLNNPHGAINYYNRVLKINPDDRESKYFLSLAYFRKKDYEHGFKYFEERLCRETAIKTQEVTYPNLTLKAPLWQGEQIFGKTIYVYYEAGFGDVIMFARYLRELQTRCRKIIFKPQQELAEWFRENFPDIEIMDTFKDEKSISFDVHAPILSLPYLLGRDNQNIFKPVSKYLSADKTKTDYYKTTFFNNSKTKIGIKWQGNTFYETGRVINVEAFNRLFTLPDIQVYSCQTYEGSEELKKLQDKNIIDISHTFKNFSDTAAAVENMDLVICNDTSLAHVAGALGKKCVILLPYQYNWRWHMDLNHCDWYDSVKLYKRERNETWQELMDRVISFEFK